MIAILRKITPIPVPEYELTLKMTLDERSILRYAVSFLLNEINQDPRHRDLLETLHKELTSL